MAIDMDQYIFGEPIQTKYGLIRYLKYKEFSSFKSQLFFINQNVYHLYYLFLEHAKTEEEKEYIEEIKKQSLHQIVTSSHYARQLVSCYILILQKIFDINNFEKEELAENIKAILSSEEEFLYFRKMIQEMNFLIEEEVSPNPEIQKFLKKGKDLKAKKQKKDENPVSNIVTSLVCGTSLTFEDIGNMTIMQVNAAFQKLSHFKNFQITSLFATVSKTEIEQWNKPITLSEEKQGMDSNEFGNRFGSMMQ